MANRIFSVQIPASRKDIETLFVDVFLTANRPNIKSAEYVMLAALVHICNFCELVQCGTVNGPKEAAAEVLGRKLVTCAKLSGCPDDCLEWVSLLVRETAVKGSTALRFADDILCGKDITTKKKDALQIAYLLLPHRYQWLRCSNSQYSNLAIQEAEASYFRRRCGYPAPPTHSAESIYCGSQEPTTTAFIDA
jgi:hypothetical protein